MPVLPVINIYPLDANGAEVAAGAPNVASFRVTHSFPASATVRFFFAMGGSAHEGTDYVGGTATNGVDYVFLPGVITIPAGSAQATILVNPYTAYSFQPETVSIALQTPPTNIFPPAYAITSVDVNAGDFPARLYRFRELPPPAP